MSNTHIFDEDLNPLLEVMSDKELEPLVDLLLKQKSEELTGSSAYKKHNPKHSKYADLIAKEIRDFGGHSVANWMRGFEGPSYYEIVCDIAKNQKAEYRGYSIEDVENNILAVAFKKALENMSQKEKTQFLKDIDSKELSNIKSIPVYKLQELFKSNNSWFYAVSLALAYNVISQIVGKQVLKTGATLIGGRVAGLLTGPIGTAVLGAWLVSDLLGPKYSVTVPAVVYIGALRKKYSSELCPKCEAVLPATDIKFCPYCGEKIAN